MDPLTQRLFQGAVDTSCIWNITCANYESQYLVENIDSTVNGICISPDGTKMYVGRRIGDQPAIEQYTLLTPWAVQSAFFVKRSNIIAPVSNFTFLIQNFIFSPDGEKLFLVNQNYNRSTFQFTYSIREFFLATPWDVATASQIRVFEYTQIISGLFISANGMNVYHIRNDLNQFNQIVSTRLFHNELASPWTFNSFSFSISTQISSLDLNQSAYRDVSVNPAGSRAFILRESSSGFLIDQYNLTFPFSFLSSVFRASYTYSNPVTSDARGGYLYVKPDGTKFYVGLYNYFANTIPRERRVLSFNLSK